MVTDLEEEAIEAEVKAVEKAEVDTEVKAEENAVDTEAEAEVTSIESIEKEMKAEEKDLTKLKKVLSLRVEIQAKLLEKERIDQTGEERPPITREIQDTAMIIHTIERVELAEAENSQRVAMVKVTGVMSETKSKVKLKMPTLKSQSLKRLVKKELNQRKELLKAHPLKKLHHL